MPKGIDASARLYERKLMKLPYRKHFTIESAAKRLGIDIEEIEYHLSEGNLRYAFPNSDKVNNFYAWFRFDELSEVIKKCVFECVKRKDWSIIELFKKHELAPLVPDETLSPEFLYLPSSYPSVDGVNVGVMNEWDDSPWASAIMELLDGERVIKLAGGYPHYFITGDVNDRNVFTSAVIAAEELDKFRGLDQEVAVDDTDEHQLEEPWKPFKFGKRNSGGLTTESIVVFGNSFYDEYQRIPSDRELWDYLQTSKKHPNYRIQFSRQLEGVYRDIKVNNETAIDYETWRKRVDRKRNKTSQR